MDTREIVCFVELPRKQLSSCDRNTTNFWFLLIADLKLLLRRVLTTHMSKTGSGSLMTQVYILPGKKKFSILHFHGVLMGALLLQSDTHHLQCHSQLLRMATSDICLSRRRQRPKIRKKTPGSVILHPSSNTTTTGTMYSRIRK